MRPLASITITVLDCSRLHSFNCSLLLPDIPCEKISCYQCDWLHAAAIVRSVCNDLLIFIEPNHRLFTGVGIQKHFMVAEIPGFDLSNRFSDLTKSLFSSDGIGKLILKKVK
jgi:hypothetical protein